jgi:hypothetical protein
MEINTEDLKTVIALLSRMVEGDVKDSKPVKKSKPKTKATRGRPKKSKVAKVPVEQYDEEDDDEELNTPIVRRGIKKKTKNKFLEMADFNAHKEDLDFDRKVKKVPPTPRDKNKYAPINVVCRVCGRKEKVNPSIVENVSRYKCNTCSTSSG